jgi:thioredoxin-like negative regulator of GroEL
MNDKIIIITSNECKDCQSVVKEIFEMIDAKSGGYSYEIINSEDKKAVEVAIEYGIDDIPGIVINDYVSSGLKEFDMGKAIAAIY